MITLVRNSLLMARHAVAVSSRAVHSLPSSSRILLADWIENSSPWKSLLRTFSFHEQVLLSETVSFPKLTSIAKDLEKEAKKKQKDEVAHYCSKMARINAPRIVQGLITLIEKKIKEVFTFEEEDLIKLFEKYDYIAIIDASFFQDVKCGAAVAIVLTKNKVEILIFWGESITPTEAECIPIAKILKMRPHRGLFVTDQLKMVKKYESGSKKMKGLMKAILSVVKAGSGNRLMYIPSKEFGLYRMCDILSRFVAGLSSTSSELQERKARSFGNTCERINLNDIFRPLSKRC